MTNVLLPMRKYGELFSIPDIDGESRSERIAIMMPTHYVESFENIRSLLAWELSTFTGDEEWYGDTNRGVRDAESEALNFFGDCSFGACRCRFSFGSSFTKYSVQRISKNNLFRKALRKGASH
jgi:hypothetical protein